MRSFIPYLFLIVPLLEISVFILVGGQIGVLATILIVLFTATLGMTLLRWQGLGLLRRVQAEMDRGALPGRDLVHGALLLVAGILLLTPGFVTDTIGFLLFIPAVRDGVFAFLRKRVNVNVSAFGAGRSDYSGRGGQGPIVDAEPLRPEDADDMAGPRDPDSPWNGRDRPD